jgi:hypothetical protein
MPSLLSGELLAIAKGALAADDPVEFLKEFGMVMFQECCALNLCVLAQGISSSRSRLLSALRREKWNLHPVDGVAIRGRLREMSLDDVKKWSFREYPPGSGFIDLLATYPCLSPPPPPYVVIQQERFPEVRDVAELTLQKDIFSWTSCFDD